MRADATPLGGGGRLVGLLGLGQRGVGGLHHGLPAGDEHQRAAHGLAWIATSVAALEAVAEWAERSGYALDQAVARLAFAEALGVDMVHFGIVVVVNIMLGLVTPPYGLLLFVMTNITGVSLSALVREVMPFLWVMIAALAVCVVLLVVRQTRKEEELGIVRSCMPSHTPCTSQPCYLRQR